MSRQILTDRGGRPPSYAHSAPRPTRPGSRSPTCSAAPWRARAPSLELPDPLQARPCRPRHRRCTLSSSPAAEARPALPSTTCSANGTPPARPATASRSSAAIPPPSQTLSTLSRSTPQASSRGRPRTGRTARRSRPSSMSSSRRPGPGSSRTASRGPQSSTASGAPASTCTSSPPAATWRRAGASTRSLQVVCIFRLHRIRDGLDRFPQPSRRLPQGLAA